MAKRMDLLETQVAQQAMAIGRPQGQLPGQPKPNPKEHCHMIMGQKEVSVAAKESGNRPDRVDQAPIESIDSVVSPGRPRAEPAIIETPDPDIPYVAPPPYVPPLPFP